MSTLLQRKSEIELIKLKEAKIKIEKRFEDMKNNPVEIEL